MQGKFVDILYSIVIQFKWSYLGFLFLIFFSGSWWATAYFEPDSDISSPSVYWWYFFNNTMRNGFSGYAPQTTGARIVNIFTFFGGGIFFIGVICKVTAGMYEQTQRRRKGLARLKMKEHIVILGFKPGESEEIINQLKADTHSDLKVVLCSQHLEENPLPSIVEFIKGDTASVDVMARACVRNASKILIHGHTDERAIAISVVVCRHARDDAHIVVYLEKKASESFFELLDGRIECLTSMRTSLLAHALVNPGSTALIRGLVSFDDAGTHYQINIPPGLPAIPFGTLMQILHQEYQAVLIGYAESHAKGARRILSPHHGTLIHGGMSLSYIADHRIDRIIDWNIFEVQMPEQSFEEITLSAGSSQPSL